MLLPPYLRMSAADSSAMEGALSPNAKLKRPGVAVPLPGKPCVCMGRLGNESDEYAEQFCRPYLNKE